MFRIKSVLPTFPYAYKLVDTTPEASDIAGSFYDQNLTLAYPATKSQDEPNLQHTAREQEQHSTEPILQQQSPRDAE